MPYNSMGSGFGQWSRGGGIPGLRSIYGYGDQGAMYNPQNPNPAPAPPAMAPNMGMSQVGPQGDFFSQLAGLMGGSMMQSGSAPQYRFGDSTNNAYGGNNVAPGAASQEYAKTLAPAQYWDYQNRYAGRDIHADRMDRLKAKLAQPVQQQSGFQMGGNPAPQSFGVGTPLGEAGMPTRGFSREGSMAPPLNAGGEGSYFKSARGNSPALGERNPLDNMPSGRRIPQSSGRASMGRGAQRPMNRGNFNYQMGGNG